MVTKVITTNEVLALLFLSTDVTEALTTHDIEMFFSYNTEIKKMNKSNYILEIDFSMYKNFNQELFLIDVQKRFIMNPNLPIEQREEKLKHIYNNMIEEDEDDIDNDLKKTIRLYHQKYLDKKLIEKSQNKESIFVKIKKILNS